MGAQEMFHRLPEVQYLVERVPIAREVLKPDELTLRFLASARETGMKLREQCEALDIPWHARKVPAEHICTEALAAAGALDPSTFVQAMEKHTDRLEDWFEAMCRADLIADPSSRRWFAFHALEVADQGVGLGVLCSYLQHQSVSASTSPAKVAERAVERDREYMIWMYQTPPAYIRFWGQDHLPDEINYPREALEPFSQGELTAQLLSRREQFREEGKRLHHCVGSYYPRAVNGSCHIVRVEKGGKKYCTAEFSQDWTLIQVKGIGNTSITDRNALTLLSEFGERQRAAPRSGGTSNRTEPMALTIGRSEPDSVADEAPQPQSSLTALLVGMAAIGLVYGGILIAGVGA